MIDYYEHKGRWLKQKKGNFLGYKHWDLYEGKIGNVNWDLHSTLTEPIETEEEAKEQLNNANRLHNRRYRPSTRHSH